MKPRRRYVWVGRSRLAIDAEVYAALEALAKVKDERQEPRTVGEMASIAMGEYVQGGLRQMCKGARRPGLFPRGMAVVRDLMKELEGRPMQRRRLQAARRWVRDVEQYLKAERGRYRA